MTTLHASNELRPTAAGLAAVVAKSLRLAGEVEALREVLGGRGYWDTSG